MKGDTGKTSRRLSHRGLLRGNRGTAALETAFVMPVFLFLMLGIFQFGLLLFWQEMLDYATRDAARKIQIGDAQKSSANGTDFVYQNIRPILGGFMDYNNIKVQVNATSDYYGEAAYNVPASGKTINAGGFGYCNGGPGQQMVLHTVYMSPFFIGGFLPVGYKLNGRDVFPIVSTAAFVDELFPAGSGNC